MKVLIIGKTGQLGEQLFVQAVTRRHKVVALSHEDLDIADSNKLERTIKKLKPDIVINATAYHVVADCEIYPEKAFQVNAIAVRDLAAICSNLDIRFVTYSTDYVFDGKKKLPYIEDDIPRPLQIYGVSKLSGEYLAQAYSNKSIIIRSCGVYGGKYGSRSKKGNFVLNILKEKNKKKLEVSSEQIVNPTYSADLAHATFELVQHSDARGIYHLSSEGYCSWAEFAQEIMKLADSRTKIIPVDRSGQSDGARRPLFSALKNYRAKQMGIVLPGWREGMKSYLAYLGKT